MNAAKTVILVILILGIIGVVLYLYFFKEKPSQNAFTDFVDVNITAVDSEFRDRIISVNYIIKDYNSTTIKQGITNDDMPLTEQLQKNRTYSIILFPKTTQKYYFDSKIITAGELYEYVFLMQRPADLKVSQQGIFGVSDNLKVVLDYDNFDSDRIYKYPIFCTQLGPHILNIETIYNETARPADLYGSGYTKCYDLGENITATNSQKIIEFKYNLWSSLDSKDYIKVLVSDSDMYDGQRITKIDRNEFGGDFYEIIYK